LALIERHAAEAEEQGVPVKVEAIMRDVLQKRYLTRQRATGRR
jgi:hypothetical protein